MSSLQNRKVCSSHGCSILSWTLLLLTLCSIQQSEISALTISPPTSAKDYRELAVLLIDAPTDAVESTNMNPIQSKLDALRWEMERSLTEEYNYLQYTSTARKMFRKKMKYSLLVAKEYVEDENDNIELRVVGMAEMGVSICSILLPSNETSKEEMGLRPQPTLGVLCVAPKHQQKGVGQALVDKCEQVAVEWGGETQYIVVDVEPDNHRALSFFKRCGYEHQLNEYGEVLLRNATVVRRRKAESRPHYMLRKKLPMIKTDIIPD